MGYDKELLRYEGGKEVTSQEAVDEFLDDEIDGFLEKVNKKQADDINQMHIVMVSDEIIELASPIEPMLLLGIARLDNIHYGAIYRMITHKTAVEELQMNVILTEIKTSRLIEDPTEWTVISNFFIENHIFEMNRIINWVFQSMVNDKESLIRSVKRLPWLEKVNKMLKAKHKRPLTAEEIANYALTNQWPKGI